MASENPFVDDETERWMVPLKVCNLLPLFEVYAEEREAVQSFT